MSGGKIHATDVTNASRTMLMNLKSAQWDIEIFKQLDIPLQMMPQIRSSSEVYGSVAKATSDSGVNEMADVLIAGKLIKNIIINCYIYIYFRCTWRSTGSTLWSNMF